MNQVRHKHTLALSLSLLLSACGGGSGGSFPSGNENDGGSSNQTPELAQALSKGDASLVSAAELRDAALATINAQRTAYQPVKAQLLQLNA
ncbi:MAG: hypothetical protein KKH95_02915, partial [Gammaproteobacteria bacterium]|nr:hypothetical protein [Gammaproteobacteria bacterium]